MGSEDPSHFGRRSVTSDRADPFESMREQREKERENFFKGVNPRDWPNENNTRGGLFNRTTSSSGSGQNVEDDVSDHSSNCSGNSNHSGETETGIPINVVHEKTLPRNKYGQAARNTTELPAKASGNESPRLERAHSEPPNKFKQRLNLANPLYSTIPENSESSGQTNRPMPHLDSRNPLKASASAPSVPSSSHQAQESHPVPPPRRSPPRNNMSNPIPPAQPTNSGANVRHIPIFVEGRPEPIFNTNVNVGQQEPAQNAAQDLSFPKPSDYYPPGVQRVKSRDDTSTPEIQNFQSEGPFSKSKAQKQVIPTQEPTTPIGPPPGPIPMGYMPSQNTLNPASQVPEPTTPQGPPPGPIPMGYLPSQEKEKETSPAAQPDVQTDHKSNGPSMQDSKTPPPPPQRMKTPPQQIPIKEQNGQSDHQEKKCEPAQKSEAPRKTSLEKEDVNSRKPSNNESKSTKEPVVNFIPIKVEHSRPESPMPRANSRAPSQEPQPRPGKSPTPARNTPQPEQQQIQKDPKIAKLDKIKEEVDILMEKIDNFKGTKKDKEYLYLDEMLTRHLIALDGIEPEGQTEIRQMRKESIKSVNRCLSLLDHKVTDGNAEENNQILSDLAAKTADLEMGNGDSSSQKS